MDVERLEVLTQKVGGRFRLTALLQKRISELVKGSPAMVDLPSSNYFEVALCEIEEGRIALTEGAPKEPEGLLAEPKDE